MKPELWITGKPERYISIFLVFQNSRFLEFQKDITIIMVYWNTIFLVFHKDGIPEYGKP